MKTLLLALLFLAACDSLPTPQLFRYACQRTCDGSTVAQECRTYCDPRGLTADESRAMLTLGCERVLVEEGCAAAACDCTVVLDVEGCVP